MQTQRDIGKYKRNWAWEVNADVYFLNGRSIGGCYAQTNNKGRLEWVEIENVRRYPAEFKILGIASIHYATPAKWRA